MTDERLIAASPRDFLPRPEDLPNGDAFFIPENDAFMVPNETAVGAFGVEKGGAMIADEERVTAWRVHYQANQPDQPGPLFYVITITQHHSPKGARAAVEHYNTASLYPTGGWRIDSARPRLGDVCIVETGPARNPEGQNGMNYRIEFAYRNMSVDVLVFGLLKEVRLELAEKLARGILIQMRTA